MNPNPSEQEDVVVARAEQSISPKHSDFSPPISTFTPTIWEDRQLVKRVLADDESAVRELFLQRCWTSICVTSRKFGYSEKELLSDLFWHLRQDDWRRLRGWNGEASVKRWIEVVAVRMCLNRVKDSNRFEPLEDLDEMFEDAHHVSGSAEKLVALVELLGAIEQLPSAMERLVMRKILEGKDPVTIAEELKTTRGNVDIIKSRAKLKLRRILNGGEAHA